MDALGYTIIATIIIVILAIGGAIGCYISAMRNYDKIFDLIDRLHH